MTSHKNVEIISITIFSFVCFRLLLVDGLVTTITSNFLKSFQSCLFYSLNFVLPYFAIFRFWKGARAGWVLLVFFGVYSTISNLFLVFVEGQAMMSYFIGLTLIAFFSLILVMLSRKSMLSSYSLSPVEAAIVYSLSAVFALFAQIYFN